MSEAVIVSVARTAIGNFGGALQDVSAVKLQAVAIKGALKKVGIRPGRNPQLDELAPKAFQNVGETDLEKKYNDWDKSLKEIYVDEVIIGNVLQGGQGQNPGRQAQIIAGIPKEVPSITVNKVCASSLKAVALAAQSIKAGDTDVVIAGGMENMSQSPFYLPSARYGYRMGRLTDANAGMVDGMIWDGLWEGFYGYHMGVTAENIAAKFNISRLEQDEYAAESNRRAIAATKDGTFKQEIVPVEITVKKEIKLVDVDEHPRESTVDQLAKLPTVFKKDGSITAGNASAITDGAAALLIMSEKAAKKYGLKPLAYIKSYASGGIDPAYMGMGVVPAANKALKLAGLAVKDINLFEVNEAFASQTLGVIKEMGINTAISNIHGGGISLGHPIGCSGARIVVTLVQAMQRQQSKYGMAALCIGGGQGMAMVIERK
ncbi:MAG TPA: acetyl-CoA C-acetyltransferase [Dehalococcoidales bacterium]|nr:acetyl-CoA C-acetyltransferase [Dehalococcoidales bacterium]